MNKIVISIAKRQVTLNNVPVLLSAREFDLLQYLVLHKNKICARREIVNDAWDNSNVIDRTVDVHVNKLKNKLGKDIITSTLKSGYRFTGNAIIEDPAAIADKTKKAGNQVDGISLSAFYEHANGTKAVAFNVADSPFGKLIVFSTNGEWNALPVKEFKTSYKPI